MRFNTKIISLSYDEFRYRICLCDESEKRGYRLCYILSFIIKRKK
nr:MAG TPA: hypothetical protein [Caudoviricetes sp.]